MVGLILIGFARCIAMVNVQLKGKTDRSESLRKGV
ncbi:hypothetical protein [Niastella yeongjuensis]|nr:hypothetical protein [Niastella yeongjuensis]